MSKFTEPRNPQIAKGINKYSRSQMNNRRAIKKHGPKFAKPATVKEAKPKVAAKIARWYPADDVKKPLSSHKKPRTAVLRSSITPGTVLILLAGKYKGRRVVFLKQLPSGLLLVTGPYKANGVPARRVNQSYVIATSTKVDISKVQVPEQYTDDFFRKQKALKKVEKSKEPKLIPKGGFRKTRLSPERKALQKTVDAAVLQAVSAVPKLVDYLGERFTLGTKGLYPHEIKF